ncbi:UDP-glucose 4-epimerase GalE [Gangjinia marincola]
MKILVTGGLGFIGSHTAVALQQKGYEVVIVDDLSNSSIEVLDGITQITGIKPAFEQLDLRNESSVKNLFNSHKDITGVIHFAASKAVGESVENPLLYYENNINSLVYLLKELTKHNCKLIFSSSCTVYGQADEMPISEAAPIKKAESPYGNTKQIGEEIITDVCKAYPDFKATLLRYFNPIGAHESGLIGELPIGVPQNLVPFITQTAIGKREQLSIFGGDYPTQDGTCIRDYIHVVDLAEAHVVALEQLFDTSYTTSLSIYNLGTGAGNSVLEVVKTFEEVSGVDLPYAIVERRTGDVIQAYADTTKASKQLGWKSRFTLAQALESAWKWEQKLAD